MLLSLGGATGSGKTALAIELARAYYPKLVILSADSRQIYKRLDIGTAKVGKPIEDYRLTGKSEPVWVKNGVSQFLIDIAKPNTDFSLADYQKEAYRLIQTAWQQDKIPMLVGGTGLYIKGVVEGYVLKGSANQQLRQQLEQLTIPDLQQQVQTLKAPIAKTDLLNKRRLIRSIERVKSGEESRKAQEPLTQTVHNFVLDLPWEDQQGRASLMVQERLDLGLIPEVKTLLKSGVDKAWLHHTGLSYRLVIDMLGGVFPESELPSRMTHAFRQLMRRQRVWFNHMPNTQRLSGDNIKLAIQTLLKDKD